MFVVHHPASVRHDPDSYFRIGHFIEHPEQARRYAIMRQALDESGHELVEAEDHGLDPILAVHDRDYVDLLATAWSRRKELPGIGHEMLTGHFARPQMARRPDGLLARLGFYMGDTSTPIRDGTWEAVYGSAQVAIGAADAALRRGAAYALCRPPGHHAYRDSAGGFCFLNNAAIAAERLLTETGGPVAILDIDAHHGNGTQGIFWSRGDVVTASVHLDPGSVYPFYAGYADEVGEGAGKGANHNLVLPERSGDGAWLRAIEDALSRLAAARPAALVVSLGFDAAVDDPARLLGVTTEGFREAAALVSRFQAPTLLVQEGGDLCDALPRNLTAFLAAYEAAREPAFSA